jgi:hypothetical protein
LHQILSANPEKNLSGIFRLYLICKVFRANDVTESGDIQEPVLGPMLLSQFMAIFNNFCTKQFS